MDSALHLIGIAKKAGRLEIGEEPVGAAARARQAKVILLAADTAANSVRRAGHFGEAGNVLWLITPYSKAELGGVVGRASCAMLAVTDAGLAASLVEKLAAADPERYGPAAAQLGRKAEKVLRRQQEQRRHEKNLQKGKKTPWAAPAKDNSHPPRGAEGTQRRPAGRPGTGKELRGGKTPRFDRGTRGKGPGRGTNTQGEGVK